MPKELKKKTASKNVKKKEIKTLDELYKQDLKATLAKMGLNEKEITETLKKSDGGNDLAECLRQIAEEENGKDMIKKSFPVLVSSGRPAKDVWEIRILSASSLEGEANIKVMLLREKMTEILENSILGGKVEEKEKQKPKEVLGHA